MTNVLITIETASGSLDLSVPARVTMTELLEMLAPMVGVHAREWTLTNRHGPPIDETATLEEARILDGTRLALNPADPEPPTMAPQQATASPVDRAALVIPDRASNRERVAIAARALIGSHRPPGAGGPVDRAARAWEWTDHGRRLEWLLSRPRIHRTVLIGVTGHRPDEVSEALADTFTANRMDRVVLVDGGVSAAVSRRLQHSGSGFEAIESALRRRELPSVERDLLFGRTRHGTLVVPRDPATDAPDGSSMNRLCESLATHAGIVVIDCGTYAGVIHLCDQIVVSTTGPAPRFPAQTIVAVWGDVQLPQDGGVRVGDDPEAMLELAVVVASGWADLGAGTPVPLRRRSHHTGQEHR
jgi:hypothetical protein